MVYAKKYPQKHSTPKASAHLPDMGNFKLIYWATFALLTLLHFSTVFTIYQSPQLPFVNVLVPSSTRTKELSMAEGLRIRWQADFWS